MTHAYGAAPKADVEAAEREHQTTTTTRARAWTHRAFGGLAVASCAALALYGSSKVSSFGIAPLPNEKPVPATATFKLDAKCIDGSPIFGAKHGFFSAQITGASVVKHNFGETDFFSYENRIPMTNLGGGKFTLTTDAVDWEWSFVLTNARGEYLYEAGEIDSPLGITATDLDIPDANKACIQKYGKYFNRVRTIDASAGNPSYTFGTCDKVCPPPPPPAPPAPSPLERTSTDFLPQPSSGGRASVEIAGNPGVPVGQFGAIATAYGPEIKKEVRAVSWYAFQQGSRSVNVHSVDKTYNQKWQQSASVTYMFTLKKLVEEGLVVTIGDGNARLYNSNDGVKRVGPFSFNTGVLGGKKPLIFCTTYTPHSYPDTFVPNVYNLNTATGKFNVGVSRVDSPWTTSYGWGDDAIVVSYVAFHPDAATKNPKEVLALGEIRVPRPSAEDLTYSAVTVNHNLGHTKYKCLATIRQDASDITTSDRTIAVECQKATDNTVTLMTMDVGYRNWNSGWSKADNVYVQYVLLPDIGAPVIPADYFSGVTRGNVK